MSMVESALMELVLTAPEPPPVTIEAVENSIGKSVKSMSLLYENRNSRIYQVIDCSNVSLVVKQSRTLSLKELIAEFSSLQALNELTISGLLIPEAISVIGDCRAYIMGLAKGQQLAKLLGARGSSLDHSIVLCRSAGHAIAKLHLAWGYKRHEPLDIKAIINDIRKSPLGFRTQDVEVLNTAKLLLEGYSVPVGIAYLDYDPLNVYVTPDAMCLIDPPEGILESVLLWDIATFTVGIRKAYWKNKPMSVFASSSAVHCIEAFHNSYLESIETLIERSEMLKLVLSILELQRLAQLMVYQTSGLKRSGSQLTEKSRHLLSCKILSWENRRIIRRIANQIHGVKGEVA